MNGTGVWLRVGGDGSGRAVDETDGVQTVLEVGGGGREGA